MVNLTHDFTDSISIDNIELLAAKARTPLAATIRSPLAYKVRTHTASMKGTP